MKLRGLEVIHLYFNTTSLELFIVIGDITHLNTKDLDIQRKKETEIK